jgi:AraC-like DNA-binding protein
VARHAGVEIGTLYRHVPTREALYDARRELAEWYLLMTREPIEAIAERLVYADASSFSRTFRRWFATAPGEFRDDRRDTPD